MRTGLRSGRLSPWTSTQICLAVVMNRAVRLYADHILRTHHPKRDGGRLGASPRMGASCRGGRRPLGGLEAAALTSLAIRHNSLGSWRLCEGDNSHIGRTSWRRPDSHGARDHQGAVLAVYDDHLLWCRYASPAWLRLLPLHLTTEDICLAVQTVLLLIGK